MADNFGAKQSRVVTVDERSLDNVVFLTCRPPLSSEWNLINQIGNNKALDASKLSLPSGWMRVGCVSDTVSESDAQSGDALTSESYDANTFKLVSKGGNVAVVNGWRVLVQGWNSPDDNNVIELDTAAGQMYDFVFLEVWRKLVAYNESLYPYGNTSHTPYTDNEILWPTVGTETSMRVQIQYRIRSVPVTTALSGDSDVFSAMDIHPIGGRVIGEDTFRNFAPSGADDVTLYTAGDGSETSQTELNTVDGYVYAVPMFLVYRRTPSVSVFTPTSIDSCYTTVAKSLEGYVKDRPDALLADAVYAQDIVDFRHQVLTDSGDLSGVMARTFAKLISGNLTTALKRGYDEDGEQSSAGSGGSVLTKAERINSTGSDNIPNMGTGDIFRRAFCNAEVYHDHNVFSVPMNGGGSWAAGTIAISSFFSKAYGSVTSVEGVYSTDLGAIVTDVTYNSTNIVIGSSSNLVGTSFNLYMEFTFGYNSSDAGFKDVPRTLLEAAKGTFAPISLGNPVTVRTNATGDLLYFGLTPNVGDTTVDDYAICNGANYTENSNFGHDLVVYRTMAGTSVTFSLTDGKLNGYYILGVKRVRVKSGSTYGSPVSFTQSRVVALGPPYVVSSYTAVPVATAGSDVEVTLITGSKLPDDAGSVYDLAGSMKFFDLNRQGRGVTDTHEMIDVVATEDSPGKYTVDTTSIGKPIIAIGTKVYASGIYEVGDPIAFRHDTGAFVIVSTSSVNDALPVLTDLEYQIDWLPTRIILDAPSGLSKIRVPVLVHAAPTLSETPYTFFYNMAPYQGILSGSTEFMGKIIAEGTSFVTSLGSGTIDDYVYSDGKAVFHQGTHNVEGISFGGVTPDWVPYAKAGDFIGPLDGKKYRILSVTDATNIILAEPFVEADTTDFYDIVRMDTPTMGNLSNIVDRLPSYMVTDDLGTYPTDYTCMSDPLDAGVFDSPMLEGRPTMKSQDPLTAEPNDFVVGSQTKTNIRGRYNMLLASAISPAYRLNPEYPRAHIVYADLGTEQTDGRRKAYQVYLFARSAADGLVAGSVDMTGRVYMMVISGETCSGVKNLLTTFSAVDAVDLFELVGRPVIKAP
jgi:hypothetical protein